MSCQQIAMRKLLNQKYEQYAPNLNPFSNILFCENWSWPQVHLPQALGTKSKHNPTKNSSIKSDIINWFLTLSHEQKCATTMIKNYTFLTNFLQTFHQWNPLLLYHIYQHRKIPNYLSKNTDPQATKHILSYSCIAWLDQPVFYFNIDPLQNQAFFQKMVVWMDKVSNNKIFEYAHKIKNKLEPQENILWFTEKSFQSLQSWIVNQFQKIIIKNYYNKNNYDLENYIKIHKLREGLTNNWNSSYGCKKQLQNLLCLKISETKNKGDLEFKEYMQKVKIYEDHYYEQAALLLDYQRDEELQKNQETLKKKKKKQKKRNKKKQSQVQNEDEKEQTHPESQQIETIQQKQITLIHNKKSEPAEKNKLSDTIHNSSQTVSKQVIQVKQNKDKHPIQHCDQKASQNISIIKLEQPLEESRQNHVELNHKSINMKKANKSDSQNSRQSQQWSNVQTTKTTTKKSGHSHPQFNQAGRVTHLKAKRSLSPQQSNNSISKLKRKQKGQKKKGHIISSWNGDESLNQNFLQTYQEYQSHCYSLCKQNNQQKETNQHEQISSQQNIEAEQNVQGVKKKKKKVNKGGSLLKQLSGKMSSCLVNRQLNNFIDSLSIQTNNLYDHKIVSFERVRFFIQTLFPTSQAILFGSNAVGLSLPTSDIDIMLFNLPCSCREQAMQILAHLAVQINTMGWIVSCSTYLNAKVPLVKLEIDPTIQYVRTKRKCDYHIGSMLDPRIIQHLQLKNKKDKTNATSNIIKVDLTVNITQQGFLGAQSTQLMKSWMNKYPQIHMCILAFKYILAQRGFSSNFKGGIGSYCLFAMVAAYIQEYPELENLEDGQFFMSTLKFYGEDFQNQIKSIILRELQPNQSQENRKSCFISLEQSLTLVQNCYMYCNQPEDPTFVYNIQSNPLRIFDPINNRIMSGSCHLYPQIKTQFRRIYKQLQSLKEAVQKQVQLTINGNQIPKMLENRKTMQKWLNKYQSRNRVSVKEILDGRF